VVGAGALSGLLAMAGWALWGLAAASVIYTVMAAVFVQRFFQATAPRSEGRPAIADGVVIAKPLHRVEQGLSERLEGFFEQDYAGPTQIVFSSDRADDPALGLARAIADAHPRQAALIGANPKIHGQNRKISNIINLMAHEAADGEGHAVIVLSDSDIGVRPDYLRRVCEALAEPGVGVVSCPYYGKAEGGVWSVLMAMGVSYQFLPNVIAGVGLGAAQPCMGSTIALRRTTLERIGGFEAFRNTLADDYAIGAAVRGLGLKSVVIPVLVSHCCTETTFKALVAHELRWAKTVFGVHPAGHMGSVLTHPTALAFLSALWFGFSPVSLGLLAAALASRLLVIGRVDRAIGRSPGLWWLTPLRDAISFGVFVGSLFVSSVDWRGDKFHVTASGDLEPV
jgi:ceramide glucosyltransferase